MQTHAQASQAAQAGISSRQIDSTQIEDEGETAAQRVIDYKVCDLLKIFVSFFTRITFDSWNDMWSLKNHMWFICKSHVICTVITCDLYVNHIHRI